LRGRFLFVRREKENFFAFVWIRSSGRCFVSFPSEQNEEEPSKKPRLVCERSEPNEQVFGDESSPAHQTQL